MGRNSERKGARGKCLILSIKAQNLALLNCFSICLHRFLAPGYVDTDAIQTDVHVSLKISHEKCYAISKHTKYHIVYFLHLTGVPAFSTGWVHSRQKNVYNAINATNAFCFGVQMKEALLYSLEHARRLVSVSPGLAPGTTMPRKKHPPPGCNSQAVCHLFKLSSWEIQRNRRKGIMRHDRNPHKYMPEAFGRVLFSQTSKQTKGPGKSELLGVSRRACSMPLLRYKEETNCCSTFMKWKQLNILTAKF